MKQTKIRTSPCDHNQSTNALNTVTNTIPAYNPIGVTIPTLPLLPDPDPEPEEFEFEFEFDPDPEFDPDELDDEELEEEESDAGDPSKLTSTELLVPYVLMELNSK